MEDLSFLWMFHHCHVSLNKRSNSCFCYKYNNGIISGSNQFIIEVLLLNWTLQLKIIFSVQDLSHPVKEVQPDFFVKPDFEKAVDQESTGWYQRSGLLLGILY